METQGANFETAPASLPTVLRDLDRAEQRACALLDGLSDVQANWQPHAGSWSILQCLDHLARTNVQYLRAFRKALKNSGSASRPGRDSIQPGLFCAIFIRSLEPPPKAKVHAPNSVVPAAHPNKDEVMGAFLEAHKEVRAFVREGEAQDLNRIRFQNPFVSFLRFRVGAGLLILTAHERRHLWQAERVRQSPGFPSDR